MRVAAPTAAQIADAKNAVLKMLAIGEARRDAPASLVAGDCLAKAHAFIAIIAPGMECDTLKIDWCSDATCKASASSFYEDCKADPDYGSGATAVKSAMELMHCEPSATEGA